MKATLVFVVLAILTMGIYAQANEEVLTTKKGVPIKPVVGDFAIGIDASPFFRYAGNLFAGNNPYFPSFGFTAQAPGSIFGKYKASATTNYRAAVLIGYSSENEKTQNFTDPDQVDKAKASAVTIGLTGGIEKHRNFVGRLSGYYGGQAGFRVDPWYDAALDYSGKLTVKDGNDSNDDYEEVGGTTFTILAGGFVGIEFYIAPRISISGEFGYNLNFHTQGERTGKPATGTEIIIDYGCGGFDFMPVASGNLVLLFYL